MAEELAMTNHTKYPIKKFFPNTAIICFSESQYSWTWLTDKQKNYLAKSSYLDGAKWIDVKTPDGEAKRFDADQFMEWIKEQISKS
jgi:hypothetical protein